MFDFDAGAVAALTILLVLGPPVAAGVPIGLWRARRARLRNRSDKS